MVFANLNAASYTPSSNVSTAIKDLNSVRDLLYNKYISWDVTNYLDMNENTIESHILDDSISFSTRFTSADATWRALMFAFQSDGDFKNSSPISSLFQHCQDGIYTPSNMTYICVRVGQSIAIANAIGDSYTGVFMHLPIANASFVRITNIEIVKLL